MKFKKVIPIGASLLLAFTMAQARSLSLVARGSISLQSPACEKAGLSCHSGDLCQCIEFVGKNSSVILYVNLSHQTPTAGAVCFGANGTSSFKGVESETSGLACNSVTVGRLTYSGGFVDNSDSGGGQLNLSIQANVATDVGTGVLVASGAN